jgi:hypothetical protein
VLIGGISYSGGWEFLQPFLSQWSCWFLLLNQIDRTRCHRTASEPFWLAYSPWQSWFSAQSGGEPFLTSETAHILTVIVGFLVVFVPLRYLLPVLVPYESDVEGGSRAFFSASWERGALLIGILMEMFLLRFGGHRDGAPRSLHPALTLINAVTMLLIAYAFFGEQLGLTSQKS